MTTGDERHVLLTGNRGYVGAVLLESLKACGYRVTGLDSDLYRGCELAEMLEPDRQVFKDIREIQREDLDGVGAVIHLAALSNDPVGELSPSLTDEINRDASVRLCQMAKRAGVSRFVYASSQSMYGVSKTDAELDEDLSEKHPLTAYARTKWEAECEMKDLNDRDFAVVCFRPSTVFGASPRLRCDIVYNNLVACAFTTGRIEIKSDGSPWRPVVHVRDVCAAFISGIEAPLDLVQGQSFNVGIPDGNFTVRDLALAAQKVVPGSTLVFTGGHSDARSYRVSFKKILRMLPDYYKPEWDLEKGGRDLVDLFRAVGFSESDFRGRRVNRIVQLKTLLADGSLGQDLRWRNYGSGPGGANVGR